MNMVIKQHSVIGTIFTISWYYHHSPFFVRDIRLKVCIGIVLLRFLAAHVVCGQSALHLSRIFLLITSSDRQSRDSARRSSVHTLMRLTRKTSFPA